MHVHAESDFLSVIFFFVGVLNHEWTLIKTKNHISSIRKIKPALIKHAIYTSMATPKPASKWGSIMTIS